LEEMGAVDWGGDCYGVASLAVGPDDALWAGTHCSGVSRFDGESWVNYTEDDGLVDNGVISIAVAPDGALWFGTGEGISRYLPGPTPW
jgi:ligand-binding sensor domain-containing protein